MNIHSIDTYVYHFLNIKTGLGVSPISQAILLGIIQITPAILAGHHLRHLYCFCNTLSTNTLETKAVHLFFLYHSMQNNMTLNKIDQVFFFLFLI